MKHTNTLAKLTLLATLMLTGSQGFARQHVLNNMPAVTAAAMNADSWNKQMLNENQNPQEEDGAYKLVLWFTNGTTAVYALQDEPVITYSEETLTVDCKDVHNEIAFADIIKYTFETGKPDNISQTKQGRDFAMEGNTLLLQAPEGGLNVQIMTIDGKTIVSQSMAAGEQTTISLSSLHTGIYLIKLNNTTYKIIKK